MSLNSCEQVTNKLAGKSFKGVYRGHDNFKVEITDKKVLASNDDKKYPMMIVFNYEAEGKRLFLEPASTGGLGSLMAVMGKAAEIHIIDDNTIRYVVGTHNDTYKRVGQ